MRLYVVEGCRPAPYGTQPEFLTLVSEVKSTYTDRKGPKPSS